MLSLYVLKILIMRYLLFSFLLVLFTTVPVQAQRSEGTAVAQVASRSVVGAIPKLTTSGQVEGTVVVAIKVDQYGNVAEAIAGGEGTTISNNSVWSAARSAAMRAHFNMSADAPALQVGTIIYTFVSSGLIETDETALRFVGVPIGGTKERMIEALQSKGFNKDYLDDYLTGSFNGEAVKIYLTTNHGIVDRVRVVYPYNSEENDTRVKYNTLLSRFNRNAKYVCVNPRPEVPAGERIYWKLQENTKAYDAVYFFLHPEVKSKDWVEEFKMAYQKHYKKPLKDLSYEEMEEALFCLPMKVSAAVSGVVWFTMTSNHGIDINYINFKNRPRGEDL